MGTRSQAAVHEGAISAAVNATTRGNATAVNRKNAQHDSADIAMPPTAGDLLGNAACRLRALGHHPALSAVLRQMAKEWVRKWATSNTGPTGSSKAATKPCRVGGIENGERAEGTCPSEDGLAQNTDGFAYLRNAAECLAEARSVLSTIITSAEPAGDAISSKFANSQTNEETADHETENEQPGTIKTLAGKKGKSAETTQPPGDGGGLNTYTAVSSSSVRLCADKSLIGQSAAISTPLGRALVAVQLEEACVRLMLGRIGNEARSENQVAIAASIQEGVTPIQRCDAVAFVSTCLRWTGALQRVFNNMNIYVWAVSWTKTIFVKAHIFKLRVMLPFHYYLRGASNLEKSTGW